jgi:hypothetical protein
VGKPEKTNAKVKYILDNFYTNTPDGLIGNEDCGQMSAWYVLSSMGIYSVTPGKPEWQTVSPYFEKIKVNFENGSNEILTKNDATHRNYNLGFFEQNFVNIYDVSEIESKKFIPVPVIEADSKSFKDKLKIEIFSSNKGEDIYFDIVDSLVKKKPPYLKYSNPIVIEKTSKIIAFVKKKDQYSDTISATFFKKPNNYSINIKSVYNPQYHAGGPEGLLDGILGTENWRKGDWQGYQSQDFEAVVDLKEVKNVTEISARFLQDQRSWILMPTKVDYYISEDNVNFIYFGSVNNTLDPKLEENTILNFTSNENKGKTARYVKVIAKNFGKLPEWHQGAGGDAFIFVDEILVK